ncbi:MAG TPA: hypothetical protein VMF89_10040 [Polyangiales bacterium]|nr:hypothetical protein [Polyangiales bacterium]
MRNPSLIAAALVCVSAVGCGNKEAPAASAEPAPQAAKVEVAAPKPVEVQKPSPADAPSAVEESTFSLKLVSAGPYKAGELSRIVVNLEPRGEFHVNQEYPIEISLKSEGASFPKASLARPDAAQFDEKKARFDVPFTANSAGDTKILANVKFAVCTDENCVPDERDLALAVAVN